MFREGCSPNTNNIIKTTQNCMEQFPSSLNLLSGKQSIPSFHLGINILPLFCYRKSWGQTGGDSCVWLSLSQELYGVLLLQRRSCRGLFGHSRRAGHRDCHNSQQRSSFGWRCQRAQSPPCPQLPVHPQKGKIPNWASVHALITTFYQLLIEKKKKNF